MASDGAFDVYDYAPRVPGLAVDKTCAIPSFAGREVRAAPSPDVTRCAMTADAGAA